MKKTLLLLAAAVLALAMSNPPQVNAGPFPNCPPGTSC